MIFVVAIFNCQLFFFICVHLFILFTLALSSFDKFESVSCEQISDQLLICFLWIIGIFVINCLIFDSLS